MPFKREIPISHVCPLPDTKDLRPGSEWYCADCRKIYVTDQDYMTIGGDWRWKWDGTFEPELGPPKRQVRDAGTT